LYKPRIEKVNKKVIRCKAEALMNKTSEHREKNAKKRRKKRRANNGYRQERKGGSKNGEMQRMTWSIGQGQTKETKSRWRGECGCVRGCARK